MPSSIRSSCSRGEALRERIDIEACSFLPKPDAYLDDQAVHEWRYCLHVLPGNADKA